MSVLPGVLERAHQQVVDVRALVERDLLPLQIRDRLDGGVLRHQDRLAFRRRRLMRHVEERRARRLSEDRRRFARMAEIDGADIQRFKQRRSRRKLLPLDLVSERTQSLFQPPLALEQNEIAVFLEADADDFVLRLRGACPECGREHCKSKAADEPARKRKHHHVIPSVSWRS
jgi:hypothetical protein